MEDLSFLEYIYTVDPKGEAEGSTSGHTVGDTAKDLFQTFSVFPTPPEVFPSLADVGDALALPFKVAAKGATSLVDAGKSVVDSITSPIRSSIKSTYVYLVGGIVLIGIIAILVLSAGSKFMGKVEG